MSKRISLEDCVRNSLERYFKDLGDDAQPHDMLAMVIRCVERPVLQIVLEKTNGNQSRAAEMLGITRSTLRRKLQAHEIKP
ncbi:MAG TPA: helix-turn-helix domain-containing protein [Burkholderiaceae bacterium]|nr:helix-turn-helix domain-containing protein [Burkholderiaceae bacterium]